MMKLKHYCLLGGLFLMASCEETIDTPDIQISTESTTYQVGQPIKFKVEGNADMISFYSGEPTNDYAYKDGRVVDVAGSNVTLSFTSAVTGGTQANHVTFLASTDFDGNYSDLASVKNATWIDITSRFKFGTSATFLNSTAQDISDLVKDGKPLYFAYRYVTKPQATNGLARTWMIQAFTLNSSVLFNDAAVTITDQAHAGFRIVDQEPVNAPSRSTVTTSRISLLGNVYKDPNDPLYDAENPIYDPENPIYDPNSHLYDANATRPTYVPYDPNSPYNDPQTENWAVSKAIYIDQVDLGPDWSQAIKGTANSSIEEFRYTYSKAGTYKAYVIAVNATIDGRKEVVHEFNFTINP